MTAATTVSPGYMDFEQVRSLLPQRFPLLMVDRVTHLEPGSRIIALKNVTGNEICFLGHFPQQAVMPGALIIEAAAQTVLLLCAASSDDGNGRVAASNHYLASANVSFHQPVIPGDQMVMEASLTRRMGSMVIAAVRISINDIIVARGELILARKAG